MVDWKYIINKNSTSEKYMMDCAVVTAINANYVLRNKIIKQNSKKYKELCELAGACYGSAIDIDRVYSELELKRTPLFDCPWHNALYEKSLGKDHVIEVRVWYKRCGLHSTLVFDRETKCNAFRVANLRWLTTTDGWIFDEDLHQISYSLNNVKFHKITRSHNE